MPSTRWTPCLTVVAIAAICAIANAQPLKYVRPSNSDIRALLEDGQSRSETLRDVIARVEQSGWIVFVVRGHCPDPLLRACLTHAVGHYDGKPSLRILVDVTRQHPDAVLATMGHELTHALEVVAAPEVVDSGTMREFFRRIGRPSVSSAHVTAYETSAAVVAGETVLQELQHVPSLTR